MYTIVFVTDGGGAQTIDISQICCRQDLKQLEKEAAELRASRTETAPSLLILNPTEIMHTYQLDPTSSVYSLRLECAIPIDHILVQSDCLVEMVDVADNCAIKCVIPCTPQVSLVTCHGFF